jgi:hypothetical protein
VAQIFYVHCPACGGKFPCHPELWQVQYDLLCPFCQHSFPQEASPLIISMTGERRAGNLAGTAGPGEGQPGEPDPSAAAESM